MRLMKAALVLLVTLYLCGGKARAQSTTGTLRGHVNDAQGLAPTQDLPLEVEMGPATVTEEVNVIGHRADVLRQTSQVATNFKQALIDTLPTNRDINAYLLLAPTVRPRGPNGAYSIAGSASFDNLFLVNGVTVNENRRGQANDLYIEDAVQETTVATAGIWAMLPTC